MLPVYPEIKAAFAAVTNDKLEAIRLVVESVCETCRKEIKRNDNFIRRVNTKKGAKPLFAEPELSELVTRLRTRNFARS